MIKTKIITLILTAFLLSGCLTLANALISAAGVVCSFSEECKLAEEGAEELEEVLEDE